ncbi:MAG: hypothetical protein IJR43_03420 [Synergistaceae bacterium]|nr:hypothetical protein [Synergistaceae bacterium]
MRIANNLPALSAFTSLNSTNKSLQKTINALSSGLRINSAADDAAGFAVSEKMRSQISGLDTAIRNSQDGISLLQTAEGALSQTNSMLQRMRELAVQACNDSLTSNDRQYIQLEIDELKDQIDRIAGTTQFNKKKLLDGSCGALWASSDLNVNVKINGGLTYIDEFGQKVSSEGNYRIEVRAEPGEVQVQKSNIFLVTSEKPPIPPIINIEELSASISGNGWTFQDSSLKITTSGEYHIYGNGNVTTNHILIDSGVEANILLSNVNIDVSDTGMTGIQGKSSFKVTASGKVNLYLDGTNKLSGGFYRAGLEVSAGASVVIANADNSEGTLHASSAGGGAGIGGVCYECGGDITILDGNIYATGGIGAAGIGGGYEGEGGSIHISGGNIDATGGDEGAGIGGGSEENGGSIIISGGKIKAEGGGNATGIGGGLHGNGGSITIAGGDVESTGGIWSAGIGGGTHGNSGAIKIESGLYNSANTANIKAFLAVENSGNNSAVVGHGHNGVDISVDLNANITPADIPDIPEIPNIKLYKLPLIDDRGPKILNKIGQFYNSNGTFLISQPKTLTITQGDGQTANITLYETDTMYDVAEKINDVIANTFSNAKYTDNPNKFCTISDGTESTSESVYTCEPVYDDDGNITGYNINATMLVRSAIPGKAGELYFSGDEELLNALGLNTIRESSETTYTSSAYNAHSGKVIANGIKTTGNILSGIIPNVDIEFDSMAGIKSSWDENTKRYVLSEDETYSSYIHLKDNVTTFQTGANKGEDFMIQLADTSCSAIGVSGVNVLTRETASRSISIIDMAINKISSQRAKIGSYENALEHTMTNLTTTSMNLTSAESRIRDADMSKLMMDFVKLQILNQSGTSMLAQANQLPQSVLSLLS